MLVGRQAQPTDPVFPDEHGLPHRPRSPELLREDLEAAGCSSKYAGQHPIDFHATRRSFATWLEANEVPGDVVDRMLGQAGKSVRKRHYSATDLEVMRKAVETIKLAIESDVRASQEEEQTLALAPLLGAPTQQEKSDSSMIPWSQLRDSNSRPTVYETVGLDGQDMPNGGHLASGEIDADFSEGSQMSSDVAELESARYGPPHRPFAARAASLRTKLEVVMWSLDAGDVVDARAALRAVLSELLDGGRVRR